MSPVNKYGADRCSGEGADIAANAAVGSKKRKAKLKNSKKLKRFKKTY